MSVGTRNLFERWSRALLAGLAIMLVGLTTNCGNKDRNRVSDAQALGEFSEGVNPDTLKPEVSAFPAGGSYGSAQKVELYANKGPVTIYYTLNGDKPTINSPVYNPVSDEVGGPYLDINRSLTLKFFAIDQAGNISSIKSEDYTIILNAASVAYQPPPGGYTNPITLRFYPDNGVRVYYTLDQQDPVTNGKLYLIKDEEYDPTSPACDCKEDLGLDNTYDCTKMEGDPDLDVGMNGVPAGSFCPRSNLLISESVKVKYVTQKPTGEFSAVNELEYFVSDGGSIGQTGNVNLPYLTLNAEPVPVELDKSGLSSLPDKVRDSMKIMEMDLLEEGLLRKSLDAIKCGPDAVEVGSVYTNCGPYPIGSAEGNLQRLLSMSAVTADITGSSIAALVDVTNLLGLEGGSVGFMQKLMKTEDENDPFLPTSVLETAIIKNLIKIHPEAARSGNLPIYLEDGLTEMGSLAERLARSDQNADGVDDSTGKKIIFTFKDFVDNSGTYPRPEDFGTPPLSGTPLANYEAALDAYNTPDGLDDITSCPETAPHPDPDDPGTTITTAMENGDTLTNNPSTYDFATHCGGQFSYNSYFGFIDPTKETRAAVMTDDFRLKVTAELSGIAQKGFDFDARTVTNAFAFDPAGVEFPSNTIQIEGLSEGNLAMTMGFRMIEFPSAFPELGSRRLDFQSDTSLTGRGTSGIWGIDSYYLEYTVMDAAYNHLRSLYHPSLGGSQEHLVYCGGTTSGSDCFKVAEVWVGFDSNWRFAGGSDPAIPEFLELPAGQNATMQEMYSLLAPGDYLYMESVVDPPQMGFYLHDLISFVANKRMHDAPGGTISEGEANVSLQLDVTLDIDDVEITKKIKDQLLQAAGKKALQDTTAALFSGDSSVLADVYIEENPGDDSLSSTCAYDDDSAAAALYPYVLVFKKENRDDWVCTNIDGLDDCDSPGKLYSEDYLNFYRDFNLEETAACGHMIFIPENSEHPFYEPPHNQYYLQVSDGQRYRLVIQTSSQAKNINFDWVRMR